MSTTNKRSILSIYYILEYDSFSRSRSYSYSLIDSSDMFILFLFYNYFELQKCTSDNTTKYAGWKTKKCQ